MEIFTRLYDGLTNNILITFVAAILPLGLGILLSLFASKNQIVCKVFSWISLSTECVCPPLCIVLLYYFPGLVFNISPVNRILVVIMALSISFLLYMPARYDSNSSFLKNTLYNGFGLLSTLFKWSFVSRIIAVSDLLWYAEWDTSAHLIITPLLLAFYISFAFVLIFEIGKRLIKQFLK